MRRDIIKEALEKLGLDKKVEASIDMIGDIAIIKSPIWLHKDYDIEIYKKIAEYLIDRFPYIKSVWLTSSPVFGIERTREYIFLAGEHRTTTVYREHGCSFLVDIKKAYISPRLSYEHLRIAKMIKEGEVVINFFSGVGGFSIIIAKHSRAKKVFSIDINSYAIELQLNSIKLNQLEEKIAVYLGDAREIVEKELKYSSDRVLLPLPGIDYTFYDAALKALRNNEGYIHVYEFIRGNKDAMLKKYEELNAFFEKRGWGSKLETYRVVRTVGPRTYQVVYDIYVKRNHQ